MDLVVKFGGINVQVVCGKIWLKDFNIWFRSCKRGSWGSLRRD